MSDPDPSSDTKVAPDAMDPEPRSDDPVGPAPGRVPKGPAWLRPVLFVLGCASAAIGVVGIILPGLPGTVFLILAAWCFTRSSPRFEAWLLDHPHLGPPVRQWRARGAIPRAAKWFACVSLAASWLIIYATSVSSIAVVGLGVFFLGVAAFIVTRPDVPR